MGLWPYPHKHNGRFYFARAQSGPATKDGSPAYRYIAPFFAGMLICGVFGALFVVTRIWAYLPFAVCGLIDMAWFWRGYFWGSDMCDGKRYKKCLEDMN
jgi:hypothetical protein